MPRNSFRHIAAAALLVLAVAAPAVAGPQGAGPLGAGRTRTPAAHHTTSLWTFFVHLIGASGGTFDPNGGR